MIVAAGLTPAWQQILQFEQFHPGEVNRAVSAHWCASGKVINAAVALKFLGAPSKAVALVGGDTGKFIEAELQSLGGDAALVQSAAPTRICTTILDLSTGRTTELVENAGPATNEELDRFAAEFAEHAKSATVVLLIGSLPVGVPSSYYRRLCESCDGRVVMDARGAELIDCLPLRPFLVKPNREELARTVGRSLSSDDDLLAAMREINGRGAEWVLVTQGGQAVWLTSDHETYKLQPPAVEVVNPIGCGDCLAAGVCTGLFEGLAVVDAVRLGMAAAAENARQLLPARLNRQRVDAIANTIAVS